MDSLVTSLALVAAFTCFFCEGIPAPYIFPSESVLPIFTVSRFSSFESDELPEVRQDPPIGNATTHGHFVLGPFNFSAFGVKLDDSHKVKRHVPMTSYSLQIEESLIVSTQNYTDDELESSSVSTLAPLS